MSIQAASASRFPLVYASRSATPGILAGRLALPAENLGDFEQSYCDLETDAGHPRTQTVGSGRDETICGWLPDLATSHG